MDTTYSEITQSETHTLLSSEAWSTATTTDPTDAAILTFNYNLYNTGSDAAVRLTGIKINIRIGDLPVLTRDLQDSFDILPGEAKGPFGSGDVKLTLDQLAAIDNGAPIRVELANYGYDDNLYDANAWGRGVLFHVDDGTADGDETVDTYLITTNLVQNETYQDTLARYFAVTTFQGATGDERNDTITGIRTPEFAPNGEITSWSNHPVDEHGWWELSVSLGGETAGVKHFKAMPAKPKTDVYLRYVLDTDADGYTDRAERDAGTDPADPQSHPKALVAVAQHTTVSSSTATVQVTLQNEGDFDASSVELWAIAPDDSITINDNLVGGGGRMRAGRQVVLGARIGRPDLTNWKTSRAKPYPDGQYEGASPKTFTFRADATGNIGVTSGLTISWSSTGGAPWTQLAVGASYTPWAALPLSDGLTIAFSGDYVAQGETFSFATALPIDIFSYTINRTPYVSPLITASYNDPEGNHKFVSDVELADIQDDLAPYLGRMRYGFQMDVMGETVVTTGTNTAYIVFNNPSDTTIAGGNVFVEFATPDGTVAKEYVLANQTFLPGPNVTKLTWSTADFSPQFDPTKDYHILAFAADRQGTIFENTVKDLDQVGKDRPPIFVTPGSAASWNFGITQQGTLLKRSFTFANTGFGNLMTSVVSSGGRWERTISSLTPTWIDTGITVQVGERVGVRAGGVACYATAGTTACFGPEGRGDTPASTLAPGLSALSLVGKIGDGAPFLVGQASTVTADRAGRLFLATNDCAGCYGDNAGAYATHIEVYGLPVEYGRGLNVVPGDTGSVELLLNTHYLATGPFERDLVIRTNDPAHVTQTVHVAGTITDFAADVPPSAVQRPLDVAASVSGVQGQWVDFVHSLQPNPASLHPVKVYSQDYGTLYGVGKFATNFSAGTASYDMFGDGRDGELLVSAGQTVNLNPVRANITASGTSATVSGSGGFTVGDAVLIHQTQDTINPGRWELSTISSINSANNWTLSRPLSSSYTSSPVGLTCGGGFWGEYFNNRTLSGNPIFARCDFPLNVNWVGGSPGGGIPSDNFSVRWTGSFFVFSGGNYQIDTCSDDGYRLYIDGQLSIDRWSDQSTCYSDSRYLSLGTHAVVIEYYENGGGARFSIQLGATVKAQVVKIPQFRTVTVASGGNLTTAAWDGRTGGLLAVMCNGTMNIVGNITVDGKGYRGASRPDNYARATGKKGESYFGTYDALSGSAAANYTGGGGAYNNNADAGSGGGGGGNATNGGGGVMGHPTNGSGPGQGGGTVGDPNLSAAILMGGGGGSGSNSYTAGSGDFGGAGGGGGGIVYLSGRILTVSGLLTANGAKGVDATGHAMGGGGAGAGGAVLLRTHSASLGSAVVQAVGGIGGLGGAFSILGGVGGTGRVRVEYCETPPSGSSNPPAITQKLSCYIADQAADPTHGRLNLPASGANTYQVQYGRKVNYSGAASQIITLAVPAGIFTTVTLQALVSDLPSNASLALDVGNTGSNSWSGTVGNGGEYTSPNLAAAFNTYWVKHGAPTIGYLDVPIRVYLDRAGQVLLTNLQVTLTGSKRRYLRVSDLQGEYSNVTLNFLVSGGNGPLAAGVDVGADGSLDWTYAGAPTYPANLTADNIAGAVNAYLADVWSESGDIDVPILIYTSPFNPVALNGFTATPAGQPNLSIGAGDVTFSLPNTSAARDGKAAVVLTSGAPVEGETVTIRAVVHNPGAIDTGPLTANFFAAPPDGRSVSIGSAFLANVPVNGAETVSLDWPTLGFTGPITVTVVVDPYNRTPETDETNNRAAATLTILTRADLTAPAITLSDPEPLAGQPVTVTVTLSNSGQTDGNNQTVTLFAGSPNQDGVALGSQAVSVPANATRTAAFAWTPAVPGPYRLLARVDGDNVVDEADEANNDIWLEVNAGLASPVLLDSGAPGELAYDATRGYGYVDEGQTDAVTTCGSETQRRDPDGKVVYRFDHLQPGHYYHLDLTVTECDGAGRQELVYVDGYPVSGLHDLSDGAQHRLSILLDPALYADRSLRVTVEAAGIDGAIVDQVNLHDIDYRYADAGGGKDPECTDASSFGWVDGAKIATWGTLPYKSVRVDQGDNNLSYCFKAMDPAKRYNLHLSFWQPSGGNRTQSLFIDGADAGKAGDAISGTRNNVTLTVPQSAYQGDGRIDLRIVRTNATAGAMVNLVVLEEQTLAPTSGEVVLAIDPPTSTVGLGQTVSVDIKVRTPQPVDGAAAYLDFDPAFLQVAAITPGSALGTIFQRSFDNSLGRIDFAAGTISGGPTTDFVLATVVFTGAAVTAATPVTFATVPPRNSDITNDRISVIHHLENGVITVIQNKATLAGHVALPGRPTPPDPRWIAPLRVTLSTAAGGPPVATFTPTSNDSGSFVVANIDPGVYRVGVKLANSLRNTRVVTFTNTQSTVEFGALRGGDANDDNFVTLVDFSILRATFGKCQGTAGYDSRADFNGDGCVTLVDFSILRASFGQGGDAVRSQAGNAVPAAAVQIRVEPAAGTIRVGETFVVPVRMATGAQGVDGGAACLAFDPAVVQVITVTAGSALPDLLRNEFDNARGAVCFAAGTLGEPATGVFDLVAIQFRASRPGTSSLAFLHTAPDETDATLDGVSVLAGVVDGQVDVAGDTSEDLPAPPLYLPTILQ